MWRPSVCPWHSGLLGGMCKLNWLFICGNLDIANTKTRQKGQTPLLEIDGGQTTTSENKNSSDSFL